MYQIEPGILYEYSYLGVTLGALVFPHGVIIIDSPLRGEDARSWRSTLINQRGGANRVLVCLNEHPDRTLGARAMECTMIAHQKVAQVFRNRPTIFKGQSVESGAIWETYGEAIGMRWANPDITFTQQMSLHWGGNEVVLEYHPGPSQGSIWVSVPEARVIFVGDAVVCDQPPFLAQADLDDWIESLDILLESYGDFIIVSGRGGIASSKDVRKQREILESIIEEIETLGEGDISQEIPHRITKKLLSRFTVPMDLHELWTVRLQQGLYQCFARRYQPAVVSDQLDDESVAH